MIVAIFIIALIMFLFMCLFNLLVGDDFKEYPKESVIIKGEFGEYSVKWRSYGFSYARAIVRNKNGKFVWSSSDDESKYPVSFDEASKMSKNKIDKWFKYVVYEYESGLKDGGYYA